MPEAVAGAGWWVPTLATSGCPYRPSRWLRSGPPTLEQYGPRVVRLAVDADRGCCPAGTGSSALAAVAQASGGPPPAGSAESRVPRPRRWERGYGCSAGGRASLSVSVLVCGCLRWSMVQSGARPSGFKQQNAAAEANVVAAAPAGAATTAITTALGQAVSACELR